MTLLGRDLVAMGWEPGKIFKKALKAAKAANHQGIANEDVRRRMAELWVAPGNFLEDSLFGAVAESLVAERSSQAEGLCDTAVPCSIWGRNGIEPEALAQMKAACRLPVAVAGAQMPDGHVGYGLPIGGVLATRGAVIPYGVGVDIACRMKLTIVDAEADRLEGWRQRLRKALTSETRFGVGAGFSGSDLRQHDMMDDPAWSRVPKSVAHLREKAWGQLGSSGSGNHFVEWGELVLERADLGLEPGRYLALLSHSGSRGLGANIAKLYTDIAMSKSRLPKPHRHLAWLDLRSDAGQEYWESMNLAGLYASANHDLIHRHVLKAAGLKVAVQIENHHNFAWLEEHLGEPLVVHRKGATPAGEGVLGIIPGSMGDPGYVVRGLGNAKSLDSAAHGAGRRMSRSAARHSITGHDQRHYLEEHGVELIAGGVDESPQAYKRIDEVMAAQKDLVKPVAKFLPRIVLMASDGKAED